MPATPDSAPERDPARPSDPAGDPASDSAGDPVGSRRRRSWVWRLVAPAVGLVAGGLFVVSAQSSGGTDLRPGRYTDLASLAESQTESVEELQARAQALKKDVESLRTSVDSSKETRRVNREIDRLRVPAGMTAVSGPGVTVTLSDAPQDIQESSDRPINDLLVHQQDIQAVVNAMWAAGAEAVTVQGQRIISTTGIKCNGNVVRLHGIPYAEPYRISGVGDIGALETGLENDPYLQIYREYAAEPDVAVGWEEQAESAIDAPAYKDPVALSYAKPTDPDDASG